MALTDESAQYYMQLSISELKTDIDNYDIGSSR